MIRTMRAGLGLAAALGLAGAVACSSSDPVPGSDTPQKGVVDAGAGHDAAVAEAGAAGDAGDAGDAGAAGQQDGGAAPFQITQCSLGQLVGIGEALYTAEINAANLALSASTNASVKALAQRMLNESTTLNQQLQESGVAPVQSDISLQITEQSALLLTALRCSTNFDRDYVAGQIIAQMTGLAFLEHLTVNNPPALFTTFTKTAIGVVEANLTALFMLQADLVGACGTACVDAGVCGDAGMAADTGAAAMGAGAEMDATAPPAGGMTGGY